MTEFNHGAFVAELRRRRKKIPADLYADLMAALELGLKGPKPRSDLAGDPPWMAEARSHLGLKEVPGSKHNPKILQWVRALGGWFVDDETPWCGTFVAICMKLSGHEVPMHWYRAKAWSDWGKASPPRIGAIAVFGRQGGGHVGFIAGENDSNLYILGGNQSNMVSIAPIAKSRLLAVRWPARVALSDERPLRMAGGSISRNEA